MRRHSVYLILAILGAILPWIGFYRFFADEGASGTFVRALFANGAVAGFTIDLLISSLVFWVFLFSQAREGKLRRPWLYVGLNLAIGLSCALPLALRAMSREQQPTA